MMKMDFNENTLSVVGVAGDLKNHFPGPGIPKK